MKCRFSRVYFLAETYPGDILLLIGKHASYTQECLQLTFYLPWGFPGGSVVKNSPASQCRRHKFDPWSRKIPQAEEQLSPCSTTVEPVRQSLCAPEPVLHNMTSHHNEKHNVLACRRRLKGETGACLWDMEYMLTQAKVGMPWSPATAGELGRLCSKLHKPTTAKEAE